VILTHCMREYDPISMQSLSPYIPMPITLCPYAYPLAPSAVEYVLLRDWIVRRLDLSLKSCQTPRLDLSLKSSPYSVIRKCLSTRKLHDGESDQTTSALNQKGGKRKRTWRSMEEHGSSVTGSVT